MGISRSALDALTELSEEIGIRCHKHAVDARASDWLLYVPIGDGIFTTKIDGWIHAVTVTTQVIQKYATEKNTDLDLERLTNWEVENSATRFAHWQVDFHWKIDTRYWQYLLYAKFFKRAYMDAIRECEKIGPADRQALMAVMDRFWDEVEVAMAYRWEIIERSRGFAPHLDRSAGADTHGYTYRVTAPLEPITFDQLSLEFIGPALGAGTAPPEQHKIPKKWPAIDGSVEPGLPTLALGWLEVAREHKMCDHWLRVPLGDRVVPTRFDGWVMSLLETLQFLAPFARGESAAVSGSLGQDDLNLGSYAVRFGLCQAEFLRRLRGDAEQLLTLLQTQRAALQALLKEKGLPQEAADPFIEAASQAFPWALSNGHTITEEILPELRVARPLHPRFAPFDPVEPLPWETADQQKWVQRMARLGYTI